MHVGIGGQGVGELQAPEAGLAHHQGMAGPGQAALAGQSAGHREIQELGQSRPAPRRPEPAGCRRRRGGRGSWPPPASWRWPWRQRGPGRASWSHGCPCRCGPEAARSSISRENMSMGTSTRTGPGRPALSQTECLVQDVRAGPPRRSTRHAALARRACSMLYWSPSSVHLDLLMRDDWPK